MASFLLAAAAHGDLEDIERYTEAKWGEEQRLRYLTGLFTQFELVAENPGLGSLRPELGEGVSSLPYESHVIFYELYAGRCHVLRVLHQARDVITAFVKQSQE